ncbi:hypothetical protein SpCBS45565_g01487 [Spizellomyces sp. 'palustris']|nr:hypothetical protein SpCBS45565_g01487 [Spizellomyces sp. 'palustris']
MPSPKLLKPEDIATAVRWTPQVSFAPLSQPQWLGLAEASFHDPTGQSRTWEVCERIHKGPITGKANDVDAVDVVATIRASTSQQTKGFPTDDTILLVLQFRPPTGGWTLEFPSGLLDKGETPETAALRELQEETGYTGTVVSVGPSITYEPGITSSCSKMVTVQVNPEDPLNASPVIRRDADEWSLNPVALPINELLQTLHSKG